MGLLIGIGKGGALGGGVIAPSNYIVVDISANNAISNGTALLAAYAAAKVLTPNGAALSATNRACVILPPAKYDLGVTGLVLDTEFVDLIGLCTNRSLQYITNSPNWETGDKGTIIQTADDVHISNLTIVLPITNSEPGGGMYDSAAYYPASNLNKTIIDNCEFIGNESGSTPCMRRVVEYSGKYTNCKAGYHGFGCRSIASGTFINCEGDDYAFGGGSDGVASGVFINCRGKNGSFGCEIANGKYYFCIGGSESFAGNYRTASGKFYNCIGDFFSFGTGD